MNEKYNVYLVSDSTGETLDRIFLSIKSQFSNFNYNKKEFVFIRTTNQIDRIIEECKKKKNSKEFFNTSIAQRQQNKICSCIASLDSRLSI